MNTSTIVCPHCNATVPAGAFCESCGKALPQQAAGGPRVVGAAELPSTAAGRQLVGDELTKQTKRASLTLLVVGCLQLVCGAIVAGLLLNAPTGANVELNVKVLVAAQIIVALIFFGLYFWARKAPLPASIVGLIVYATLVILNVINSVSELRNREEGTRTGIGGLGIGWLDIVIMILLAQGISAGLKHKRLMQQGGAL